MASGIATNTDHGFWIIFSKDYTRTNLQLTIRGLKMDNLIANVLRLLWIEFPVGQLLMDDVQISNTRAVNDFGLVSGSHCTFKKFKLQTSGGQQKSVLTFSQC